MGEIHLPQPKPTPSFLQSLFGNDPKSLHYKKHIRAYNAMFAFTSTGGIVDKEINKGGRGPYTYKLNGQNHHLLGSLLPPDGQPPRFCQLYIYDTENEVQNRIGAVCPSRKNNTLDEEIVSGLMKMLDTHNPLVRAFRMARDRFRGTTHEDFKLILLSSYAASGRPNHISPSNEVAALMVGDMDGECGNRDVVVQTKEGLLQRIDETFRLFMQLQYPLLFPYGEEGFHLQIPYVPERKKKNKKRKYVTMREFYCYRLMLRLKEAMTLRQSGRLLQQYIVDAFTAIDQFRLNWIRNNQKTLRTELYSTVRDAVMRGDNDPTTIGKCYVLPASFTGSIRYMSQYFQDSMAICRDIGRPTLFITMTCNPKWPEIQSVLDRLPNVKAEDCPDLLARVFKLKLEQFIDLITKKNFFGRCIGIMYVIEFQKRGLPHAHMLIWLADEDKPKTTDDIDKIVSAEIPDKVNDINGYEAVSNFMIHGPCSDLDPYAKCMHDKHCTRFFPKKYNGHTMFDESGFPIYRRRKTCRTIKKNKKDVDNRFVVPYNRDLLVMFQCHINVEICNNSRSLKYLFKYCLKGYDRTTMLLTKKKTTNNNKSIPTTSKKPRDEIKAYLDGRYICAAEAAWRIFGFDIHYRYPSVERLPIHLPDEQSVTFDRYSNLGYIAHRANERNTKLEAWFIANETSTYAHNFTYQEFPKEYVWDSENTVWSRRRKRVHVVGRLSHVSAKSGELWYLRMLLIKSKGAKSFADLRTVNGTLYQTYKEACAALGMLDSDNEWHQAIRENADTAMPFQIRQLFVYILTNCKVAEPKKLWDDNWQILSDDILYYHQTRSKNPNLKLSDEQIQFFALAEIEKLLNQTGKSLKDFKPMPIPPTRYMEISANHLVIDETSYDTEEMKMLHNRLHDNLNSGQKDIYDSVVASINREEGGLFFVYGSGGCGKTFLWKTLIYKMRSEQRIVLPVASSGIAATLLPGGRTAHSRFHIPIKPTETTTLGIKHGSDEAELLKSTTLVIWDEAPMLHRHCFEAVDRSLRDIMSTVSATNSGKPFGGITFLLGGDFRQILPVVPKGNRAAIINASLTSSKLWQNCKIFVLHENMRLHSSNSSAANSIIDEFSKWVLNVGNGTLENLNEDDVYEDPKVRIPDEFVIHSATNHIDTIIESTYPNFLSNYTSPDYLKERAILTPTNASVDQINSVILDMIPGESYKYYSVDTFDNDQVDEDDPESSVPVEYFNSVNMAGLPKHELVLKEGVVVMLMRNVDQILGLCNGTRLIVKKCMKYTIDCEVISGSKVGTRHIIPRMEMSPSDSRFGFEFSRRQLPIQICYAMTVNKSQGQSLNHVGLYLSKPVFSHGQLYVAVSRVTSPEGLRILIESDNGGTSNITKNIVYDEVFYTLP